MNKMLDKLGKELLFLDGGMGTLLQAAGLHAGELPETWNIERPEVIRDVHYEYLLAGSDIVLTNTFGANRIKYHDQPYSIKEVVEAAVENVRVAAKKANRDHYWIALDMGPTGKLLEPLGDLSFEETYEAYKELAMLGEASGAHCIHIETMSDTYEVKAAVLAAKENTNLPVFVTLIFDEKGKLLTGADVPAVISLLEGLRVNAIGINCGMGPEQMMPILNEISKYCSLPVIVKPNAGLPKQKDGVTYYDVEPEEFADAMVKMVGQGACVIGGCCGTTPEHIRKMIQSCKGLHVVEPTPKEYTIVSSYGTSVILDEKPIIIGERINPTGKSRLKQALKEKNMEYILKEAVVQQDMGAHVLDINVGLPDIDEAEMMSMVIKEVQSISNLPLQIDTVDEKAMDLAMRIYNGKPMINSVSGKKESMNQVFPLVKKYGGVVVGLTLDEDGIPNTAQGRLEIAKRIIEEAKKYGIHKKDIVIDVLTMTISSEADGAKVTLEALERVAKECGVKTVLGVSNISFGLPNRPIINSNFYTMALQKGLTAGIVNPASEAMMQSYDAYCTLMGYDANCQKYIEKYTSVETTVGQTSNSSKEVDLKAAIEKGLKEEAQIIAGHLLTEQEPLEMIQRYMIPALDEVGKGFEKGTVFLPQLLMSADAAKAAFEVIKEKMSSEHTQTMKKDKIILATVKGDIHDIGKNIVKVLLENYNFDVIDLGKDVPPETIVETAVEEQVSLVGLSALMTTTVISMEETIRKLKAVLPECKVMVGGAVLNQDYADMIKADFYGKDAMQSVYYAQKVFAE